MSAKFDFSALQKGFTAVWPVTVNVPQDGGTVKEETFNVRFRLLGQEEINTLAKDADPFAIAKAYLVEMVDGPELTDAMKTAMLDAGWVRGGLAAAYNQFATGAAAKN